MLSRTLVILLIAVGTVLPAAAQDAGPRVDQAWARATIGRSQVSAAYASLTSQSADRLIGVETPIAQHAELHTHTMKSDGTMEMRGVDAIALKAGETVVLKPNGPYHVMLIGLKQPLKPGESFPMTFIFQNGGRKTATVKVESARAMGPSVGAGS